MLEIDDENCALEIISLRVYVIAREVIELFIKRGREEKYLFFPVQARNVSDWDRESKNFFTTASVDQEI